MLPPLRRDARATCYTPLSLEMRDFGRVRVVAGALGVSVGVRGAAADPSAPAAGGERPKVILAALCVASSLAVLNAMVLAPFLSDMSKDLNTTVAVLGQAVTLTAILGAFLGLMIGPLGDRVGYRTTLLAGLGALILCNIGTSLAPSFPLLLAAQLINGFSGAAITPMAFSIAGSRFDAEGRRKVISYIYAAASAAGVIGFPILTQIGGAYSWRWSFAALALTAACGFLFALLAVPHDPPTNRRASFHPRAVWAAYAPLMHFPPLRHIYVAQFLRGVAWSGTLTYIGAFLIDELHRSVKVAGLVQVVVGPGFLIGSLLVSSSLRRYDGRVTFIISVLAMAATMVAIYGGQPQLAIVFVLLFICAFGGGIAEVTAVTMMSSETPTSQGTAMALNSSVVRFGSAGGAFLGGGMLAIGGYTLLGIGYPIILGLAAASAIVARRHHRLHLMQLAQGDGLHAPSPPVTTA